MMRSNLGSCRPGTGLAGWLAAAAAADKTQVTETAIVSSLLLGALTWVYPSHFLEFSTIHQMPVVAEMF
jgi:hypothetical protein